MKNICSLACLNTGCGIICTESARMFCRKFPHGNYTEAGLSYYLESTVCGTLVQISRTTNLFYLEK